MRYTPDNIRCTKRAFTLMEMLIVIAILGIFAAIILPEFQTQSELANEAAAKDDLRILRNVIDLYAVQHNNVPPGYANGDIKTSPSAAVAAAQLTKPTNVSGQYDQPDSTYKFGPYLKTLPQNPFNQDNGLLIITNTPTTSVGSLGWLYNPETKKIYLNWHGTDTNGTPYIDY